jgi:ABC-type multidrug transport system fused ATPase/permease subunit
MTYFDTHISTEWYVKLSSNIDRIAMGIGEKLSAFISSLLIPIFGIIICMFTYWPLALVLFIWILLGVFTISWLSKVSITFDSSFGINIS